MSQPPYNPQDPYQQYGHGQQYPPQYGAPQGPYGPQGQPGQPGPYGYQPQPPRKPGRGPVFWVFVVGLPLVLLFSCTAALIAVGGRPDTNPVQQPPVAQRPSIADEQTQPPVTDNTQPMQSSEPAAEQSQQADQGQQTTGIGSEARDGLFAFTVTKLERTNRVGNDLLHKDAQGEFLMVYVTVKNIGDKAGHFFGDNQKVFDGEGREYSADSGAAIYMPDSKSLYEEINPGNQVNGVVLFDLPKGVKATSIVLHDSMLSGGIKVTLGSV